MLNYKTSRFINNNSQNNKKLKKQPINNITSKENIQKTTLKIKCFKLLILLFSIIFIIYIIFYNIQNYQKSSNNTNDDVQLAIQNSSQAQNMIKLLEF